METFGDRLRFVRGSMSQVEFAELLQTPKSTLSNYENNKTEPSFSFIVDFCSKFGVSFDWLFTGKNPKNLEFPIESNYSYIPLVEAVLSAGTGSLETNGDELESLAFQNSWIEKRGNPKNMVCMRVSGDSMEPEIYNKDVVLIDQSKKDILVSNIYAVSFDDSIYIKRIEKEPNKIILVSTNKEHYRPIEITMNEYTESQFRIIGRVLWISRDYA